MQAREVVRAAGRPVPAFRVEARLAGVTLRSWITDTGEVVKEESPMGHAGRARDPRAGARRSRYPARCRPTCSRRRRSCPLHPRRIDDPTTVARLRVRIDGLAGLDAADLEGAGQSE